MELSPNQYLRELLENAFEALNRREDWGDEFPQVQIHPEWNEFDRSGVCQFVMCDNGVGFPNASALVSQCKTMMSTGNSDTVSLRDGNFGMGGRISTLYWNSYGVIYASWHKGEGWMIELTDELIKFCVQKGSIAIDGVSLTIASVNGNQISVALVPHTLENTTLGSLKQGGTVNIETDVVGRYLYAFTEDHATV